MSIEKELSAAVAPQTSCADAVKKLTGLDFAARLCKKDPELWKKDPAHKKQIAGALGWVDIPFKMQPKAREITAFAEEIRAAGFTSAVLLGMGGSSLAPEVIRSVFQNPKYPRLHVMDTTDPAWISAVTALIDIRRTLFIFASKSGGTIEPSSQFKYFWGLLKKAGVKKPGENFMAITDSGTGLEKLAKEKKFLKIFINPSDIGGRFSALSYFGMVPAALCGADVAKLLERAAAEAELCKNPDIEKNPGAMLGALMAGHALAGRDKLTLVMPEKFKYLGLWVEQLVAESTGKEGKGITPVCMEPLMAPDKYQADRFFVRTSLGAKGAEYNDALAQLETAGHPVHTITAADHYDLGAEFFRWEAATAAAGAVLEINPFDQPNVQEAKLLTMKVLEQYRAGGKAKAPRPDFSADRVAVYASRALKDGGAEINSYDDVFWSVFSGLKEKEYIGLLAYLPNSPLVEEALKKLRAALTDYTSSACTLSYGPRYLHSSGQLHKGGPDNALFIILTNQARKDIMIPGEKYTFWQLETAQALGDFEALDSKNRRVLRLHLKHPLDKSLAYLSERIAKVGRPGVKTQEEASKAEESEMAKIAVKKTTPTKTVKTKLIATDEYVVVDHPKNLETILAGQHYAVRIGSSACTGMDISINDQPWQPCRNAVGYWWYDWANFPAGTHQLVARMHKPNGEYLISKRRRCKAI